MRAWSDRIAAAYRSRTLLWGVMAAGILLRLAQYAANRAFWVDEALLAMNIRTHGFSGLLGPLNEHIVGPIGFLWTQRLLVQLFGEWEYVQRLYPLLCGLLSLFLFREVARRRVSPDAFPLAVGLFAISNNLIYYASMAKQYEGDVFFALLLLLAADRCREGPLTLRRGLGLVGAGIAALSFSLPSVFVAGGTGLALASRAAASKDRARLLRLFAVFLSWGAWLGILYVLYLRAHMGNPDPDFWLRDHAPFPPRSASDFAWYPMKFFETFVDPLGFREGGPHGVAAWVGLFGACALARARRWWPLALWLGPVPLMMVASMAGRYPILPRMILFLVPAGYALFAEGVIAIRDVAPTRYRTGWVAWLLAAALCVHPVWFAMRGLVRPRVKEEIRDVLDYAAARYREGESFYVYEGARPAFAYYAPRYPFPPDHCLAGRAYPSASDEYFNEDAERIRQTGRAWILFSHIRGRGDASDENRILSRLDTFGRRLESHSAPGAAIHRYVFPSGSGER
ncbi:MAG: glycosyltransferase family 39 protein [Planctomycetes bacterium]|nr:glycosyltransferase family 39 protein [Planctomycetota bacterium]